MRTLVIDHLWVPSLAKATMLGLFALLGSSCTTGPAGAPGSAGPKGDKGDPGSLLIVGVADGGSIYFDGGIAIVEGPRGPEGQVMILDGGTIQGPPGPAGAMGSQGPKGDTGATGAQGPIGLTGPKGDIGLTGPQGPAGSPDTAAQIGGKLASISSGVSVIDFNPVFTVPQHTFVRVRYGGFEPYDLQNEFDTTTGVFTAKNAGRYQVCASVIRPLGVAVYELDVFINGARNRGIASGGGSAPAISGCRTVQLEVGNTLEIQVYHDAVADQTFSQNSFWNWLTIDRLF